MSIVKLDDLREISGALMGIDPGSKTFGLAISDRTRLIASPLLTIKRKKFTPDAAKIFIYFNL
jgi:putative Holliday junction resolvase